MCVCPHARVLGEDLRALLGLPDPLALPVTEAISGT